jgi:hypothetical protein
LPKGNPDDNPVETIFSDVQQMVLDTTSDTDPAVTRRRIVGTCRAATAEPTAASVSPTWRFLQNTGDKCLHQ